MIKTTFDQLLEATRQQQILKRAPEQCLNAGTPLEVATRKGLVRDVSQVVVGWPSTENERLLIQCKGIGLDCCSGCPLKTDPSDPTHFKYVEI